MKPETLIRLIDATLTLLALLCTVACVVLYYADGPWWGWAGWAVAAVGLWNLVGTFDPNDESEKE